MKAIRVAKYDGPEELQLQEVAQPEPGAGEALVRVHASGVNYADIYFRNGTLARPIPFPFTLGIEGAGEIEAVGEGVPAAPNDAHETYYVRHRCRSQALDHE